MAYSLVIRNGLVVDGTGRSAYRADVAVEGDRIVQIGQELAAGEAEIDAAGLVVAPGFIDVHTHYDPQFCWDKLATPTPEHGVTSLVIGNCSVSLAPVSPEAKDKLIGWFGSVEDMDSELMRRNVDFNWETFEEYVASLKVDLGPNVGALLGHAVLRVYVMGAAAQQRAATDQEIARMVEVLHDSLKAGAFGLSFTFNHLDDTGNELPCFYADKRELLALAREVAAADRIIEVAPNLRAGADTLRDYDIFGEIAVESNARVSLSPILAVRGQDSWRRMVERLEFWRAKGARMFAQTQVRPLDMTVSLTGGSPMLGKTPLWRAVMDAPAQHRPALLYYPKNRRQLAAELEEMPIIRELEVRTVHSPENKPYIGRKVGEIATERGQHFGETFIEVALNDELATEFLLTGFVHAETDAVAELLNNPAMHIGSADAGAHITSFSGAGDTGYLFEKYVRQEKAMTLERAVQRLTFDLARDWNIADRGEIAVGRYADIVIFDPETIARLEERWVEDLPNGDGRYTRGARGIAKVIVNGEVLVNGTEYTEVRSGKLL